MALTITLGNFLPNFGHEKCPRLPSSLLWNSARPYRQPAKSENRSGFIAIWESTGTNKQCFDKQDKSCEEGAFYRYLACLVFEYFETSFMSAKKEFLGRFLREKSGWGKLWKRFYIFCLVPISQKRKRGKHEEGIYPLFWCFSCLSLELTQMIFFFTKNTIFRSIRFTSRLLMDELKGFGWLARSKEITPLLRGYPILSKAISTSWIVKTKC